MLMIMVNDKIDCWFEILSHYCPSDEMIRRTESLRTIVVWHQNRLVLVFFLKIPHSFYGIIIHVAYSDYERIALEVAKRDVLGGIAFEDERDSRHRNVFHLPVAFEHRDVLGCNGIPVLVSRKTNVTKM